MALFADTHPLLARTSAAATAAAPSERLRAALSLVKPRIVALVVFTAAVAGVAAAGGAPPVDTLVRLVISGSLAAGGAAALNHYLDRDLDARMERTRRRPLVTGQIRRPGLVLLGGLAMVAVGVALGSTIGPIVGGAELFGAFIYAGLYSLWLKRRTPLNIVIGGAAGSAAVVGGWAAVEPGLGLVPWVLAGLVFVWTPAHFWSLALARRAEYCRARVPMLPVVAGPRATAWWTLIHVAATVLLSLWLGLAGPFGAVYDAVAVTAGLGFLAAGLALVRRPDASSGWRVFKCSGPYLGLIFLGILVDTLVGRVI